LTKSDLNLIQLHTALSQASDHPQRCPTFLENKIFDFPEISINFQTHKLRLSQPPMPTKKKDGLKVSDLKVGPSHSAWPGLNRKQKVTKNPHNKQDPLRIPVGWHGGVQVSRYRGRSWCSSFEHFDDSSTPSV
jgi:hypothetical protein